MPLLRLFIFLFVLPAFLIGAGTIRPTHAGENVPAVQLSSFAVPAFRKSGTRQMMPITLFLELDQQANIVPVCHIAPRLVETSLATMGMARLRIAKGRLDLGDIDRDLRTALNALFAGNPIRKVHILRDHKSIGSGAARQLGAALGCSRVPGFDPSQLR